MNQNYWDEESFEDTVAAALIACFETKVHKNRGASPGDRLTDERIALLRKVGPYIPSNSRIAICDLKNEHWEFDIQNDPLPEVGCFATQPGKQTAEYPGCYLWAFYVRRTKTLGKYWHRRSSGVLYEMILLMATKHGIQGERRFFTVGKTGEVLACIIRVPDNFGYKAGAPTAIIESEPSFLVETSAWASVTLQFLADRRFCWSITAQEHVAKAHLGCMKEEIKSLLYARTLPMTATGRKRPILHLVEAHQRRMKAGIDIDITAYLKGLQTVEISGTAFTVRPPVTLAPYVSQASRDKYFPGVIPPNYGAKSNENGRL